MLLLGFFLSLNETLENSRSCDAPSRNFDTPAIKIIYLMGFGVGIWIAGHPEVPFSHQTVFPYIHLSEVSCWASLYVCSTMAMGA